MSWRDPNWVYQPAATHGDSQAFAHRQKMRAIQAGIDYYNSLDWNEYIVAPMGKQQPDGSPWSQAESEQ